MGPDAPADEAYAQTLQRLFALTPLGVKLGLERPARVAAALGNPQDTLAVIHIGGTNGKGSTAAMVESIARAAGMRTGLYTSPHLHRFTERIRVSGTEIGRADCVRLAAKVEQAAAATPEGPICLTFFELTTLIAFEYFREQAVELAVIEVGLGGRLDATNLVRAPLCTVVTSLAVDHQAYLGHTLAEIAYEKAGIFKPERPALVALGEGAAAERAWPVFEREAERIGAPLRAWPRDFDLVCCPRGGLEYRGPGGPLAVPELALRGDHQRRNAALALAATSFLVSASAAHRAQGLARVRWPGRLETIAERPRVVVDCAHNAEAAQALASALGELDADPLFLLYGTLDDKDAEAMLALLAGRCRAVWLTRPPSPRAADPASLAAFAPAAAVEPDPAQALAKACAAARAAGPRAVVLAAGSVFLCAEVRRLLLGERSDPISVGDPLSTVARP